MFNVYLNHVFYYQQEPSDVDFIFNNKNQFTSGTLNMLPSLHPRLGLPAHLQRYHRYCHIIWWGRPPRWPQQLGSLPPHVMVHLDLAVRKLDNYLMKIFREKGYPSTTTTTQMEIVRESRRCSAMSPKTSSRKWPPAPPSPPWRCPTTFSIVRSSMTPRWSGAMLPGISSTRCSPLAPPPWRSPTRCLTATSSPSRTKGSGALRPSSPASWQWRPATLMRPLYLHQKQIWPDLQNGPFWIYKRCFWRLSTKSSEENEIKPWMTNN